MGSDFGQNIKAELETISRVQKIGFNTHTGTLRPVSTVVRFTNSWPMASKWIVSIGTFCAFGFSAFILTLLHSFCVAINIVVTILFAFILMCLFLFLFSFTTIHRSNGLLWDYYELLRKVDRSF